MVRKLGRARVGWLVSNFRNLDLNLLMVLEAIYSAGNHQPRRQSSCHDPKDAYLDTLTEEIENPWKGYLDV